MHKFLIFLLFLFFFFNGYTQTKTASYSGVIKRHHSQADITTGKLILINPVTGVNTVHLIDIGADGRFSIGFPLLHKQSCWISFPSSYNIVYFEPGSKVVHDLDLSDLSKMISMFKGDLAGINNDLWKARDILMKNENNKFEADVYGFSPDQYKTYYLAAKSRRIKSLDSLKKDAGIGMVTYNRLKSEIDLEFASRLISYNYTMENAYRLRNQISFADKTPVTVQKTLAASYYDFLEDLKFNDLKNMGLANYPIFLKRLEFIELIEETAKTDQITSLKSRGELDLANPLVQEVLSKYRDPEITENARRKVLKMLTNVEPTLELELISMQNLCNNILYNQQPLTDSALMVFKKGLKYPHLLEEVELVNNEIKKKISDSKQATGFIDHATPNVAADSIMGNILEKYKGKLVFIDFWATWCGPCLQAISQLTPLKAELTGKDIVFLYITNETSPEKAYKIMAPGIKGEHYRITTNEYNQIMKNFGIVGFPHYAIANQEGLIVDKNFRWAEPAQVKQKLLSLSTININ